MKRNVLFVVAIIVLFSSVFAMNTQAAGPTFLMDFTTQELFDNISSTYNAQPNSVSEYYYNATEKAMYFGCIDGTIYDESGNRVGGTNGDVQIVFNQFSFNANDALYFVICMKNLSESSVIQAYFAGDTVSKPSTQSEFRFVNITPSSNEYKTYIYDVKNYFRSSENQHLWDQNITLLRFDFMFRDAPGGGTETGEHVLVKYMAFFKTQADAEAFAANSALAGNSSQTTTAATTTTSPSTFDGAAVMATAMVLAFTAAVVVYRKKAVR